MEKEQETITDGKITISADDYSPIGIVVRGAELGKRWFDKLTEKDKLLKT